jgi:hypothetical protein
VSDEVVMPIECETLDQVLATREFVRVIGGTNGRAHATVDGYVTWATMPGSASQLPELTTR